MQREIQRFHTNLPKNWRFAQKLMQQSAQVTQSYLQPSSGFNL